MLEVQEFWQVMMNGMHPTQQKLAPLIRIIIPGQFIKRRKWWFGPPHQGRFVILTMMAESAVVSTRVTSAILHLHAQAATNTPSPSRHYYPRLIAGTNLLTWKGWIAWWAKADCTHITFAQGYYTIEAKGTGRKWTQVFRPKTNSISVNQLHLT